METHLVKRGGDVKCAQQDLDGSNVYAARPQSREDSSLQDARNMIQERSDRSVNVQAGDGAITPLVNLSGSCENRTSEATRENAVHDLQDKLGAEAAGLVWALKQLDRYLK